MALKKKPKVEDLFIGSFVLLAFLYPFIITFIIEVEERGQSIGWKDKLRIVSLFVAGLEECTTERAIEVARFFDRRSLQELGGVEGLLKMCSENKELLGNMMRIEETFKRFGNTYILEVNVYSDRGTLHMSVSGSWEEGKLKIIDVSF